MNEFIQGQLGSSPVGQLMMVVQAVQNGYLLTVNGISFVIQGDGVSREADFDKVQDAMKRAFWSWEKNWQRSANS